MPGVFSGKLLKGTNPNKEGVTYGPLVVPRPSHPAELTIEKTMGKIPITPDGAMQPDPAKVIYLKS